MKMYTIAAVGAGTLLVADAISLVNQASVQQKQMALESAWEQELDEPTVKKYESPVKRVVNLLGKMKAELDAEAKNDADLYDKMVCWCQTNEKEKTQSVSDAEAKDLDLTSEIEGRGAKFGELETHIKKTKEEIEANTQALQKATSIREKEAGEFKGDEQDSVQAITNLRNAIAVLSKHQGSMLQLEGSTFAGLRAVLRDAATKYDLLRASHNQPRKLLALISVATEAASKQEKSLVHVLDGTEPVSYDELPIDIATHLLTKAASKTGTFLQASQPVFSSRSSNRSGGIFGILTQMLEEFEGRLSESQKEELKAQADFKALSAAKSSEIEASKRKLDDMETQHAKNSKGLSDAKEDLTLTRNKRSEDVEFLQNLKLKCNDLNTQMERRTKSRNAETQAVAEAIKILTEDDNREQLAKMSFLQVETGVNSKTYAMRLNAAAGLRKAAIDPAFDADDLLAAWYQRSKPGMIGAAAGPRKQLSALATSVQLDGFGRVKEMIDKMVAELKKQQQDEVDFKTHCNEEFDTNEKTVYAKNEKRKDLEASINQLETSIAQLKSDIDDANNEMSKAQVEIKKAGENREQENKEYQGTVSDQRATQAILKKALMKLKDYYHKGINKAALSQVNEDPVPPVHFNDYKDNSGSSPVITLIETIIQDSADLENTAVADETASQKAYETFVTDTNGLIASLQEAVTKKTKNIASNRGDKALAEGSHESTVDELESLGAYKADLHNQCDFVLKNFEIRQRARLQEMEAIRNAKAILSGSQQA